MGVEVFNVEKKKTTKNTIADVNLMKRGRIVYRRGNVLSIHNHGTYSNGKPNETANTIGDRSGFEHFWKRSGRDFSVSFPKQD